VAQIVFFGLTRTFGDFCEHAFENKGSSQASSIKANCKMLLDRKSMRKIANVTQRFLDIIPKI